MKILIKIFILVLLFSASFSAQTWTPVGLGLSQYISNIKVDTVTGNLYVSSLGSGTSSLFKYNGTTWSPLGAVFNGPIESIEIFNNEIYVAGSFTASGGTALNKIAKWSGANWIGVGGGVTGTGDINILKSFNNKIYVGGSFNQIGSVAASKLAVWDGTSWASVGTGTTTGDVSSFGVYNNNLIIGGTFTTIGGISTKGIVGWSGTGFSPLGSGLTGINVWASSIDTLNNELYVAVSTNSIFVTKWNGSSWSQVGGAFNGPVRDLTNYKNQIIIGGGFTNNGLSFFAKLSGNSWTNFGTGTDFDVFCLGKGKTILYAGGLFTLIDGQNIPNIAQYATSTTGLKTNKLENSFIVYPNPLSNKITLQLPNDFNYSNSSVEVFDNLGKQVFISREIEQNKVISLEFLPTGLYHLKIKNDDSFKVFKILKQ